MRWGFLFAVTENDILLVMRYNKIKPFLFHCKQNQNKN